MGQDISSLTLVDEVKAYVAELVEAGQETAAADLALLLGQTLVHTGQWQCAVDACKSISPFFADTKNQRIPTSRQPLYRLDYPNMEIREAFSQYWVESYTNVEKSIVPAYLRRLHAALESGDADRIGPDRRRGKDVRADLRVRV